MTKSLFVFFLGFAACTAIAPAKADTVTITGNLSSDGTAVGSGDPVITDPSTINIGDPFSLLINYDPASFNQSGSSHVLTDATAELQFDGYEFDYSSAAGNYIEFASPGAYGAGTTSFQICTASDCQADFINLYFTGGVTNPSSLAGQAGGLAGDGSASPSEFEFLRNFADGSQTDLQGTIAGISGAASVATPEPSMLAFAAVALAAFGAARRRRIKNFSSGDGNE
ncbi:MAG TPA: PEP-CTERM sorting domain-containing protein [Bryobacteraceae bacterium]|nr:PEP-CTERM sorting domain-containing protein [Bryobacteraceae bacterium]